MNIDTIYNDIVQKVLPTIGKGLMITKDYVSDLIGRYIKYLIVIDSLQLVFNVIIIGVLTYLFYKILRFNNIEFLKKTFFDKPDKLTHEDDLGIGIGVLVTKIILCFVIVLLSYNIIQDILNVSNLLLKDIFVPEVRIYDIYRSYK